MSNDNIPFMFQPGPAEGNDVLRFAPAEPSAKPVAAPSESVIDSRAAKYTIALEGQDVDTDVLKQAMLYGTMDGFREHLARTKDVQDGMLRNKIVEELATAAATEGRQLTGAEQDTILGLTQADVSKLRNNPKTFLEEEYAKRVIARAHVLEEDTEFDNLAQQDEITSFEQLDAIQQHVAKKEVFQRLAEDVTKLREEQGWVSFAGDVTATMIPTVSWYNLRNLIKDEGPVPFLLGANLEENIRHLYSLPLDKAAEKAEEAVEYLKGRNLLLAERFANAMLSYSGSDEATDNFWNITDLATIVSPVAVAKSAAGAAKSVAASTRNVVSTVADAGAKSAVKSYRDSMTEFVRAISSKKSTPADVLDAAGDTDGAALSRLKEKLDEMIENGPGADIKSWDELKGYTPTLFNPETVFEGATKYLSANTARRLITAANDQSVDILNAMIVDPLRNGYRVSETALRSGLDEVVDIFKKTYRGHEDTILDTRLVDNEKSIGNNFFAEVFLGSKSGTPFKTKLTAQSTAKTYFGDKEGYEIVSHGAGFAIKVQRPIDITSDKVRDQMIVDLRDKGQTPVGNIVAELFRGIRSGEDVLPTAVLEAMKVATYGGSAFAKVVSKSTESFVKVKDSKAFFSFLKAEQNAVNPANPGQLGYYSKSLPEFEQRFYDNVGRAPSEDEASAYFDFVRLNEVDLLSRNLLVYHGKTTTGHVMNELPGFPGKFEGVPRASLPPADPKDYDFYRVLVIREDGSSFHTNSNAIKRKDFDEAKKLVDEGGYGVVQLSPAGQQQIKEIETLKEKLPKGGVDFIVTKRAKTTPLPFNQVPNRSGVHQILTDSYVVRQPTLDVGDSIVRYYDDINLYQTHTEKDAAEFTRRMNVARELFAKAIKQVGPDRKAALKGVKSYVENNLPISYRVFARDFNPKRGRLDANVNIHYTKTGQTVGNSRDIASEFPDKFFVNLSSSKWNTYKDQVNLNYAMQRGDKLSAAVQVGDANNPMYSLRPASYLDPMESIERGLRDVIRGRHFEDLKLGTADRFIAEFGDILDTTVWTKDKQRIDPFMALLNPEFIKNPTPSQADKVRAARVYSARFKQFIGIENEWQKQHNWVAQKILNGVSPEMATGFRKKLYEIINMEDGPSKLKALAFHAKIGLWNPIQLFVQANTLIHTAGIVGPTIGSKATVASMVQSLFIDQAEGLTKHGAKLIKSLGFDEQEFIEVTEAMRRSGFDHVGREIATREQHLQARIMATKVGKIADHGLFFFNKSERFVRRNAFNAAYLEWKQANGARKLTDRDIVKIVNRADLLNNNMSQASNAAWQQGWASVPTQFWSYQVRLTEALLGRRINGVEAAKLLTTYATVYGVPTALAAGTAVIPFMDQWQQYAAKNKIDVDSNVAYNTLTQGLLGAAAQFTFGERTNISERYGPSGLPFVSDIISGDKGVLEALSGATGTVFAEVAADVLPIFPWITDAFIGSHDPAPPSLKDFTDVFTNISSLKVGERIAVGLAIGGHVNKHGEVVDSGYSGIGSVVESVMGLTPARVDEFYTQMLVGKERSTFLAEQRRLASKDAHAMMEAVNEKDREYYQRRVNARLSTFTAKERMDAMTQFFREDKTTTLLEQQLTRLQTRDTPQNDAYWNNLRKKYRIEKGQSE